MKNRGGLDHIGIYVSDLDKSIAFYKMIFCCTEFHRFSFGELKIVVLDLGNGLLELEQRPDGNVEQPKRGWSHIAFNIKDYDRLVSKLEEMGVEMRKVICDDGSHIAFFKDPDGHDLEIVECAGVAFQDGRYENSIKAQTERWNGACQSSRARC